MGVATILYWLAEHSDLLRRPWPTVGLYLGYGALAGAAVIGTIETYAAISDILAGDFF